MTISTVSFIILTINSNKIHKELKVLNFPEAEVMVTPIISQIEMLLSDYTYKPHWFGTGEIQLDISGYNLHYLEIINFMLDDTIFSKPDELLFSTDEMGVHLDFSADTLIILNSKDSKLIPQIVKYPISIKFISIEFASIEQIFPQTVTLNIILQWFDPATRRKGKCNVEAKVELNF